MNRALLPVLLLCCASLTRGDQRTQPPTLTSVSPTGIVCGKTIAINVEGSNLTGASRIFFSDPGLTGRILEVKEVPQGEERRTGQNRSIDLGDRPPKNHVLVEVTAAPETEAGVYRFRLLTNLGTSNTAALAVSPFPEVRARESQVSLMEDAEGDGDGEATTTGDRTLLVKLPATLIGTIKKAGEVDSFHFEAQKGEQAVFQAIAGQVGSSLEPELVLLDSTGKQMTATREMALLYVIPEAGKYTLEVRDYQHRGGPRYFYRINAGAYPYLAGVFPLGVRRGSEAEILLRGANLDGAEKVKVKAPASTLRLETFPLRAARAINRLRLAVGEWPEIAEREPNDDPAGAQAVSVPVTINGKIAGHADGPDRDFFRFSARKGQRLVLEVMAQRLGSPLDSVIEVLDGQGRPIERATLRPVFETAITLNDPDSARSGMRILSWPGVSVNDSMLVGNELLKVAALPKSPDEDIQFASFRGQRLGWEDTTPEAHAVNTPVYKVQVHPPGRQFPPNGMPIVRLHYRNDDAQGLGPAKDSLLHFTAPADGEYLVRVEDVRALQDDRFAYRLTIREPAPDFILATDPQNPNVPRGGSVAVRVTATRLDGMDAPIEVRAEGLPASVTATTGVIPEGQVSTWLLLTATPDATQSEPAESRVVGRSGGLEHVADPEDQLKLLAFMPPPDVKVWLEPSVIALQPGQRAEVTVRVERAKGFTGRVPVDVVNLPPGVMIPDVGLNGVLVTEQETNRKFTLVAEPWAHPIEQPIYALGRVETRSPTPARYASAPLQLQVQPGEAPACSPAP